MSLYNYIVTRDFGFAPNPFPPCCTLATCKPGIRNSAKIGDWVVGIGSGAKSSAYKNRLIYAMKVEKKIDFDAYWNDPKYARKKPIMNGSVKQNFGDNVYHRESPTTPYIQANSHHSLDFGANNSLNYERDLKSENVLLSNTFWYFGKKAPLIPDELLCLSDVGRGYCKIEDETIIDKLYHWLEDLSQKGYLGQPIEFEKGFKRYDGK